MAQLLIGPKRCGGAVSYDQDGNLIRRYACEVHLFDPGVCAWQRITNNQCYICYQPKTGPGASHCSANHGSRG